MRTPALLLGAALLAGCGKSGCGEGSPAAVGSASASASAPASASSASAFGLHIGGSFPVDKVLAAVNPDRKPPYAGPKGTLKGTIRMDGDPPPDSGLKFIDRCKDSEAAYGKLFRVGLDKALADVLVTVTNYGDRGFVPAAEESVKVAIHRCAPTKLTYAVTYGQRLDASNLDKTASYMPYLNGAGTKTVMVAVPGGDPVKLYPTGPSPAHYMLRDQLDSGFAAHVFVLNYATTT